MKQKSFNFSRTPVFHGGELALGKRKTMRPLARKKPIHLTLKARRQIYPHAHLIERKVRAYSEKFHLRIYGIAVAKDHVHFVATIPGRKNYVAFIRSLTALLARILGKGIWLLLPFSRVGSWGRAYESLKRYLEKNRREASGEQAYEPRKDWYGRYKNPIKRALRG